MGKPGQIGDRHHYVPRLLLRNFTHDKSRQRLFIFDKQRGRSFPGSVDDIGQEHGFNDILLPDGRIFPFEPVISGVDHDATGPLWRLLDGRLVPSRNSEDRRILAEFIAVQRLRGPNSRKLFECLNQVCVDTLGADSEAAKLAGAAADYTPAQAAFESTAAMMTMVPALADSVLAKEWLMIEAHSGIGHFCISDNPIVLDNERQSEVMGTIGFDVEGIEISIPLSSSITLFMICPLKAREYAAANPSVGKAIEFGRPLQCDAQMVDYCNRQQIAFAERFVYQRHNDFQLAQEMLREFPQLAVGPRFSVASPPLSPRSTKSGKPNIVIRRQFSIQPARAAPQQRG
jgi:hypothetical protein